MALKTPLIVDIETDGRPAQVGRTLLVGYQLADEDRATVAHSEAVSGELREMLADPERPKVSMTKFDPRHLTLQGWDWQGPVYDLQVMAWVMNENQMLALDPLAKRYAGITMDKRIKRRDGAPWFTCDCGKSIPHTELSPDMPEAECHWRAFVEYCRRDVEAETKLFNTLWSRLEDTAWLDYFLEEEVPFTRVLLSMETAGLPVSLEDSEVLRARLEVEAAEARASLISSASLPPGFNVNSGDQMAAYLYSKVFELTATLEWDEWKVGALKSCLADEHDDCELSEYVTYDGDETYARHVVDLLPDRFTIDTVGRTQVHGRYTLKGRGLPPTVKTDSGKRWSTSSPVLRSNLAAIADEWVRQLLEYRKVDKVLTTYLRRFPELAQGGATRLLEVQPDGGGRASERVLPRLYGRFNQTGTKTGRLSSSEPNLQNIPARGPLGEAIRGLFQGDLVVGDYSQLEPRLLAHFSQDPVLLRVYREGEDIYNVTGTGIFGKPVEKGDPERDISKVVFLGDQYGMGPTKLAATLTMNGFVTAEDTAKAYQQELHSLYRVAELWKDEVRRSVKSKGYVTTIGGRHRRLKAAFEDRKNWKNVGYGERQAVNAVIQGSAGDIVRRAMVAQVREFIRELLLLAQVHDELVNERLAGFNDTTLPRYRKVAEEGHGYSLTVPLVFEPHEGSSWFTAKEGIELPDDLVEETTGYEEDA